MRKALSRGIRTARYLAAYARPPFPADSRPERDYAGFLRGCRVALVGPAPSVVGTNQGETIDGFHRVVRLNHALPIPRDLRKDVGTRTDILYHNLWAESPKAPPFEELVPVLKASVEWVCACHPYSNAEGNHADHIDAFLAVLRGQVPFRTISPRAYLRLKWRNRFLPSAGLSAIQDLLRFDIRELYITGFTFYQGKQAYHQGYRGVGLTSYLHPPDRQLAQVRRWVADDSRIRPDETLSGLLGL